MQKRVWSSTIIIIAITIILAGCQSSTQVPGSNTDEVSSTPVLVEPTKGEGQVGTPSPQEQVIPETEEPYPPPGEGSTIYNPYPGPSEGQSNYIDWSQAETLILNGEVTEIYQAHSRHITLVLSDGDIALSVEPEIDQVFDVVERCGGLCSDVILATE